MVLKELKVTALQRVLRALSGKKNMENFGMDGGRWAPASQGYVWNVRTEPIYSGCQWVTLMWHNATTNLVHAAAILLDISDLS